jgi:RNA recognition motif-containing protein
MAVCYRAPARDPFALPPWFSAATAFQHAKDHLKSLPNRCSLQFRRPASLHFLCEISMTKLYVGNLPFTATEEAVRNLFAPHGTVEKISLINDRDTGQPRGFGFVEMSSADASRAMQALNGKDFDGRALKINEAQDKARSGGGGGGGRPRY